MSQRIVHVRYSADSGTIPGTRFTCTVTYVGVTPSRARYLFNTSPARLYNRRVRILSIKRGN